MIINKLYRAKITSYLMEEHSVILYILKGDFTMNNEVIETAEEVIEKTGMSKGVKIAAGIGLSVVVGVVVYKYVAKPVIANIKAQIEQKKMAAEERTVILNESEIVTEDN